MIRPLAVSLGVLICLGGAASAQNLTSGFGRFELGMSVAEARAAAPEQDWNERSFGDGGGERLLTATRGIQIGQITFTPVLDFRASGLATIRFSGGGPIASSAECDEALVRTVAALEREIGALSSFRAPGEYGDTPAATRTTSSGSEVRFYNSSDTIRVGFATQRGERYVQVTSMAAPVAPLDLACVLTIEMQSRLNDFQPLTPPTSVELAAAQEIDPDWAETGGSRVTELTMPAQSLNYTGQVRVRLDCLVVEGQRINCAVESEDPPGMNFGAGALAATRFYRIHPVIDGQSTFGKRVRVTIRYELVGRVQ